MRNLKLTLEYAGTNYSGWQVQSISPNTIQQILEKSLYKILGEKVKVIGSGRTDAGVHAIGQVANFHTHSRIPVQNLQAALNAHLPADIVITRVEEVDPEFHAIADVKTKVYRYIILNRPYRSGLLKDRAYFFRFPLDLNLMRKESRCLIGKHDFKAFCASHSSVKSTVRSIKKINLKKIPAHVFWGSSGTGDDSVIIIDIEADGFLYNMVRGIVGTLIEIGRGRFPEGSLRKILESCNRKLAGPTVPARGLSLIKVNY
jgi:tRNA pseudouridine38-40 synthase